MLIGIVGLAVLAGRYGDGFAIGHVGAYTPLIILLYAVAAWTIFTYERRERASFAEAVAERYPDMTLRRALARYAICAVAVTAAGAWLPFVALDLAQTMGWKTTFVGTVFVAAAPMNRHISATLVRQIAEMKGDPSPFVPAPVARRLASLGA